MKPLEINSLNMESLLFHLREATAASHEMLDAAFGSLDLSGVEGYKRFLSGHAIGLASLHPAFRTFVERDLELECPDYPAMLATDLATVGIDVAYLPTITPNAPLTPNAVGYVIAGSRLGLTSISRNGYWGRDHNLPSTYMEDTRGLAIWKATAARLKQIEPDLAGAAKENAAAVAVFDAFRAAFDAAAPATAR